MAELGESTGSFQIAEEELEDELEREPIKIRFSLFFDGTLNNRTNTEARELAQSGRTAANDKEREMVNAFNEHGNDDTSYDNGLTNIAKMEKYVEMTQQGNEYTFKTYIEGPGTADLRGDKTRGYAFGGGSTGVPAKVRIGISRLLFKLLGVRSIDSNKNFIEELKFDVFGFSRGAAAARYCVHKILNNRTSRRARIFPLFKRLQSSGFQIKHDAVKAEFAGLYDTVASYGFNHDDDTEDLCLDSLGKYSVTKTIHLVAADEHRKNFSLTNVESAPDYKEIFLPGVHSDIGGSYLPGSESRTLNRSYNQSVLENDKSYFENTGWYDKEQINIVEGSGADGLDFFSGFGLAAMNQPGMNYNPIFSLVGHREFVQNIYSNIPLQIMAKFAREQGINITAELEEKHNYSGLEREAQILFDYAQRGSSSVTDWQGSSPAWLKSLRNRHLHMSAHLTSAAATLITPNEPNIVKQNRQRKVHYG